jgi:uracil phosphoribosyltransferase
VSSGVSLPTLATQIWAAAVDPELTEKGLIRPGLGDTGDRLFNTVRD